MDTISGSDAMKPQVMPKWARELTRFMSVKPQFMLWGNIYDVYPMALSNGAVTTLKIMDYLKALLKANNYNLILGYEPLYGLKLLDGDAEAFKKITGEQIKNVSSLYSTVKERRRAAPPP
ncbi:hypothetical protein MBAV_006145, partial [Candidatus Magnetobacterium bavaricum]